MFLLDGGPRSGQLVDDLPDGYAVPRRGGMRAVAPGAETPWRLVVADIPATLAVWGARAGPRGRRRP